MRRAAALLFVFAGIDEPKKIVNGIQSQFVHLVEFLDDLVVLHGIGKLILEELPHGDVEILAKIEKPLDGGQIAPVFDLVDIFRALTEFLAQFPPRDPVREADLGVAVADKFFIHNTILQYAQKNSKYFYYLPLDINS